MFSSDLFLDFFNPVVNRWCTSTQEYFIPATCASLGINLDDVSLTGFADDLARAFIVDRSWDTEDIVILLRHTDVELDLALSPSNFMQNHDKRVCMFKACGKGAYRKQREFYRLPLDTKCSHFARYLGPDIHVDGSAHLEVSNRASAANRIFGAMAGFWGRGPKKFARMLHRGSAIAVLVSAASALHMSSAQYRRWDTTVAKQVRRMYPKLAAGLTLSLEGGTSYKAMPNGALFSLIR